MKDGLTANLLEISGRETIKQLDYIGSLNIQLWATLRGMRAASAPWLETDIDGKPSVRQMLEIGVNALP